MNVFEMIIVIVVVTSITSMATSWMKQRRKSGPPADDRRLNELEERIRVLERIVTDSGYEVRRQFRDLERDA